MENKKTKIVFIGSQNRSGSTLLDLILSQFDQFTSVGELRHLLDQRFSSDQLCGCGKPFHECDFWQQVFHEAGITEENLKEVSQLVSSVDRIRYIPQLGWNILRTKEYQDKLEKYSSFFSSIFNAISHISGARVIIDSSKTPSYGFILNTLSNFELYFIHLVRDSRAVTYSAQRKKIRHEIHWKKEYMPSYSILQCSREWNIRNLTLTGFQKKPELNYLLVRYEDLVTKPEDTVLNILSFIQEEKAGFNTISQHLSNLTPSHTVAGNPMRFQQGSIKIRPDLEWKENMSQWKRYAVTVLTLPFLLKYKYLSS